MKRFLGWSLALFVGACSVPDFSVEKADAGLVDPCVAQSDAGRTCGGACPACADGRACDLNSDCLSSTCTAGECTPAATCSDGKINGAETDQDCGGGTCGKCGLTLHCVRASDCDSGLCAVIGNTLAGSPRVCFGSLMLCEPTTCSNTLQCADAMTQAKPLPTSGGVCGWQMIHCDNGCDSATGSCK